MFFANVNFMIVLTDEDKYVGNNHIITSFETDYVLLSHVRPNVMTL